MTQTLGDNLRAARERKGLSQAAAAEALGMAPSQLSKYERDVNKPGADALSRFAGLYGVPSDQLLNGTASAPASANVSRGTSDTSPLPPLEPQWASSPVFWAGAQWATAGIDEAKAVLDGRLREIQRAVLAHLGQLTRPAPGARAEPADELRVWPDPIPLEEPAEETTRPAPRRAGGGKR